MHSRVLQPPRLLFPGGGGEDEWDLFVDLFFFLRWNFSRGYSLCSGHSFRRRLIRRAP